jgi:hypothetical protein
MEFGADLEAVGDGQAAEQNPGADHDGFGHVSQPLLVVRLREGWGRHRWKAPSTVPPPNPAYRGVKAGSAG